MYALMVVLALLCCSICWSHTVDGLMDYCCKLCVERADHWVAVVSELSVVVTNAHDRHTVDGLIDCCYSCVSNMWTIAIGRLWVSDLSIVVTNAHDRHRGNKGLINAAIRHAKDQLDLDLSPCSSWLRFVEVHYARSHSSTSGGSEDTSEVWAAHKP